MRVLIDGTMARGGGGHTYLVNVMPRLAALAPEDEFRLMVRSERVARSLPDRPNLEVELLPPVDLAGRLRFTHLQIPRIANRWRADVFFSAGETAPVWLPCPSIASFRNPNLFTELDQGWSGKQMLRLSVLRALAAQSAWSCDRIMFVSEDSARWIGDAMGLPESRRVVVQHGIDGDAWKPQGRPPVHPFPYILSVSSIYRYKNFVRLIEAYAELARQRADFPDLLIIGDDQDPEYARKMQAARAAAGEVADQIHILGELPYSKIADYYAAAELFVFPSYLETFGHPLLEAMAAEVPVVAADIPVFREIGGDAALYADPHSSAALAGAMHTALFGFGVRETLIKRGRERVRQFSWERSARTLHALLHTVVAERAHTPAAVRAAA